MTKVGDEFLQCTVSDGDGKIDWTRWRVRTIRGGFVYAIAVYPWTWGKRSKKRGDFGWLDPIGPLWRRKWRVGGTRPPELGATRLQAITHEIASVKRYGEPDDYDRPETYAKAIRTLQSMQTRERNRRSKRPARPSS